MIRFPVLPGNSSCTDHGQYGSSEAKFVNSGSLQVNWLGSEKHRHQVGWRFFWWISHIFPLWGRENPEGLAAKFDSCTGLRVFLQVYHGSMAWQKSRDFAWLQPTSFPCRRAPRRALGVSVSTRPSWKDDVALAIGDLPKQKTESEHGGTPHCMLILREKNDEKPGETRRNPWILMILMILGYPIFRAHVDVDDDQQEFHTFSSIFLEIIGFPNDLEPHFCTSTNDPCFKSYLRVFVYVSDFFWLMLIISFSSDHIPIFYIFSIISFSSDLQNDLSSIISPLYFLFYHFLLCVLYLSIYIYSIISLPKSSK